MTILSPFAPFRLRTLAAYAAVGVAGVPAKHVVPKQRGAPSWPDGAPRRLRCQLSTQAQFLIKLDVLAALLFKALAMVVKLARSVALS